ncbi:ABC transporter ATP-binding protein [Helicobacter anatolicus]|uniref:ABC transporter ATP-binding protein n=1 Tax=Helicobacter anatolicus TaxID=2905874 RepID=UPI001E488A81|nr:ABC transporter ATP-binding protein [Helicobacter anatolicus]MCE3036742.1 ABC transporter ATP-binding protein/permease [Helicobacter anatolicus]MCE3039137.1 ABC transporter ATP-binding protein/permease [Helicobacter anatolicus]
MKKFYFRFWPYIREYKLFFTIAILATSLTGACTAWGAYLIKPALDEIFIKKDSHMLIILPLFVILAYSGKGIGILVQTYFMNYIGLDIVRRVRNRMLEKMLEMEINFFNSMRNGELIARITNDIGLIRASVSNYFAQAAQEIFTVVGLIGVVIYQSPKLAFIGLIIMPLASYPLSRIIKKIKKIAKENQEKNSDITAKLSEIFNNIEIIKANNGEKIEAKNFALQNEIFFKLGLKSAFWGQLNTPIMEFLGALAIGLIIYLGGREVISGNLSAGEFFSFITALFMMYTPIKRLVNMVSSYQEASVASDRIFEILERTPLIKDGAKQLEELIEVLDIKQVGLKYGKHKALENVSMQLKINDIVAFVGKSGGGKSSLVNLLLRLYDCTSGEICINQQNIKDFTQYSIREQMAIVTQRIFIFHDSVLANVAYGSEIDEQRVQEALKKADALDFVEKLPQGIHTILDEFGSNLSGGQRQRIAIARAIYKNPRVLILDEATSALDSKTEESIKETISKIAKDKIIILIAHRPSTIELANKVFYFEDGKVIKK